MGDGRILRILEELREQDRELGSDAEGVWEWLTFGEGVGVITQESLQRFLWYELPLKWAGPPDTPKRAAQAAAVLLDRLGLDRYADICRSDATTAVHAAYRTSRSAGFRAFRKAEDASGIDPPDLDDFAWGSMMGSEEAVARSTNAAALEEAIVGGELTPGGRRWRIRAREIAAAALDSPHPELPGQSWRTAIITERLGWWSDGVRQRSRQVARLRGRHVNRLLHPIAPPQGAAEAVEPLRWFLNAVGDGVGLTQAGYLARAFVVDAARHRGWVDPYLQHRGRDPRSESEVTPLYDLHELARTARAVHHRARTAKVTKAGKVMADDPAVAWKAVAFHFPGAGEWEQAVCELTGLMLLDREEVPTEELWSTVAVMVAGLGWRTAGEPPGERVVSWAAAYGLRMLEMFSMVERLGDWQHRRLRLTPAGEATVLAYLRSRAAGPRGSMWA